MSGVYNVPMALDPTLSHTEGLEPALALARNIRRAQQAREYVLGPMPVSSFIDAFLPSTEDHRTGMLSFRHAFKDVPQSAASPSQICEPLAAALNRTTKRKARCPGFIFEKTMERSVRPSRQGYLKPHICCFAAKNAELVRNADMHTRVELGYAELFINVHQNPSCDYFVDPPPDADKTARKAHNFAREFNAGEDDLYDEAERAFGLHIAFVTEMFARQHRLLVFSVSLYGSFARLFRWDRAGCVVTEAFDIREKPELLLEFLWRFSQVSYIQRGHDSTVVVATPEDEARFRDAITAHARTQLDVGEEELAQAVKAHYEPGHATVVRIFPPPPPGTIMTTVGKRLIVSRPVVSPLYLEGRGTRGYWALSCDTGQVVFLKDTWRTHSRSELEGDILQRLNELAVRHVPLLVAHGDAPESDPLYKKTGARFQLTRTGFFAKQAWRCRIGQRKPHITRRQHYRLVMDTAGYGLNTLRGTRELLHATHDAFTAMRDALSKDSRIHRDLSIGNIILVKEPGRPVRRGYLIDWEASDHVDEGGEAKHAGRAGTWDFMSIRMLGDREFENKHTFKDDMESLLYVVLYCALLYLAHDVSRDSLTAIIQGFFRWLSRFGAETWGGTGKKENASTRRFTRNIHFRSAALQEWLTTVMDYFAPLPADAEKYRDMWDAAHLDAFWSEFLETRTLEGDDRVVHELARASEDYMEALQSTTHTHTSEVPDPPRLGRRPRVESDDAAGPSQKKARHDIEDTDVAPARTRGKPPADVVPRRSERIRGMQSRPKPPAVSTPISPAKPAVAETTARTPGGRPRTKSRR